MNRYKTGSLILVALIENQCLSICFLSLSSRIRTVSAEIDSSNKPSLPPRRLISEPTGGSITEASPITADASQTDPSGGAKGGLTRQQHVLNRSPSGEATGPAATDGTDGPIQWHQMPKEIWKQAAEVND